MRFLLLDRITSWEPGVRASGVKNIALSEDFFDDHFPLKPIMPGVLILEGMAQLSGILIEEGVRKETEIMQLDQPDGTRLLVIRITE